MVLTNQDSIIPFAGDGITTIFPTGFPVLAAGDLEVELIDANGVPAIKVLTTDYSVQLLAGDANVTMVVAPLATEILRITRWLDATQDTNLINNSKLDAEVLESDHDRIYMVLQQLLERTGGTAYGNAFTESVQLSATNTGLWDAQSRRIINVADPVNDQDAATKIFVQGQISGAGNVPAPLLTDVGRVLTATAVDAFTWVDLPGATIPAIAGGDADKMLRVNAGETAYELRTPAQVRTDLGLGTAAVLNVGTAANDILQLDGSAKIPAVDGSQLTGLGGIGDLVRLDTQTASVSADIQMKIGIDSTFKRYIIELIDVVPDTDASNLEMNASNDGGTTYETTSFYDSAYAIVESNNNDLKQGKNNQSEIVMNRDASGKRIGSDGGEGYSGTVKMSNPASAGLEQLFQIAFSYTSSSGRLVSGAGGGSYGVAEAIDAIRFRMDSGNIESGTFVLYGVKDT